MVCQVGVTDPISYALGKTVLFVDRSGKKIETSIDASRRPGARLLRNAGHTRAVTKVVLDQD